MPQTKDYVTLSQAAALINARGPRATSGESIRHAAERYRMTRRERGMPVTVPLAWVYEVAARYQATGYFGIRAAPAEPAPVDDARVQAAE